MLSEEQKSAKVIYEQFRQFGRLFEVIAATKFGFSDILSGGPKSLQQICSLANTEPSNTQRLLRALVGQGYYDEIQPGVYKNTILGDRLRKDDFYTLCPFVNFMDQVELRAWHECLPHAIKTGDLQPFEYVFKDPLFTYMQKQPQVYEIFNDYMKAGVRADNPTLSQQYNFSEFETLCDVAGGTGDFLIEILQKHTQVKGILFDQSIVIDQAKQEITGDLVQRIQFESGSFFEQVPQSSGYILKRILHDFSDDDSTKILKNIRRSIHENGKLFIVEKVIKDDNSEDLAKHEDLDMLILPGGKERTQTEFYRILQDSKFELANVIRSNENTSSIIVAKPV